ncbi:MAG TPA: hypothetical protein VF543_15625 [Pyrinomonadaceae bacterium]|jgi:hypothetical protein
MTGIAYLHGEGILFSFLIHAFFFLLTSGALFFGLLKFGSKLGAYIAIGYIALTLICTLLALNLGSTKLESLANLLTSPWNLIVPCYNLDSSCPLSFAVAFISAELNAVVLYFLTALSLRRRDD